MAKPILPVAAAAFFLTLPIACSQTPQAARPKGPMIGSCPVLPADNIWNTPIDNLPRDPHSEDYLTSIGLAAKLHPNFGSPSTNGIPIVKVAPGTKSVRVAFTYSDESDPGGYPIPRHVPIEGGPTASPDSDRHVILVDEHRCVDYELYNLRENPDGTWAAGSGVKFDLTSNALRPANTGSADAAGLPILPGLIRYDEVAAGEIKHAIRFTASKTQRAYIWPARHFASGNKDPKVPPMGLRIRLRADFDISSYSSANQTILRALKKYGMILADNGSSIFMIGATDPRWNDDDLHKLTQLTGKDFEAVDESLLQMHNDSGRIDVVAPASKTESDHPTSQK